MMLLTFPLLVVSAPVLLLARGRYGARLFVGLVIAMLTPVALFFVEGMLMAALRRPDVLPTSLKAFATTLLLINMHVAFVLPVHLLDLLQRFLRRSALPVAPGAIGYHLTPNIPGVVLDALRLAVVVGVLHPASGLLGSLKASTVIADWHLPLMVAVAVLVVFIAKLNERSLPGWGHASYRSYPLWHFRAHFGRSAARTSDGLAAVFSRRSRDLRAIAGNR